jgi:hypothetical protein
MDYENDRKQGIEIAKSLGATRTAAAIRQGGFRDIFTAAAAELGMDKLVAQIVQGPPVWSHMALLNIPDLGNYAAALTKRAAEAPSGAVSPGVGTAPSPTHTSATAGVARAAMVMGGPLSIMSLHNAMAADCQWTVEWMDGGSQQPTQNYSDWNKWLWSGTLTAGCGSTIKLSDFAAKVPLSPLNNGDTVWIYVWVAGGTDQSGANLTSYQFTYNSGSTLTAAFVISGTTTINTLSVASYQ